MALKLPFSVPTVIVLKPVPGGPLTGLTVGVGLLEGDGLIVGVGVGVGVEVRVGVGVGVGVGKKAVKGEGWGSLLVFDRPKAAPIAAIMPIIIKIIGTAPRRIS